MNPALTTLPTLTSCFPQPLTWSQYLCFTSSCIPVPPKAPLIQVSALQQSCTGGSAGSGFQIPKPKGHQKILPSHFRQAQHRDLSCSSVLQGFAPSLGGHRQAALCGHHLHLTGWKWRAAVRSQPGKGVHRGHVTSTSTLYPLVASGALQHSLRLGFRTQSFREVQIQPMCCRLGAGSHTTPDDSCVHKRSVIPPWSKSITATCSITTDHTLGRTWLSLGAVGALPAQCKRYRRGVTKESGSTKRPTQPLCARGC